MFRLSSIHRIVLGLVSLTVTVLLLTGLIGLIPNSARIELQARRSFCEATAVSFMEMAARMDSSQLEQTLERIRQRNSQVESIGVRKADGVLVLHSGPHALRWQSTGTRSHCLEESIVPVSANGEHWGQLEVRWHPMETPTLLGVSVRPDFLLTLTAGLMCFVAYSIYLHKVMRHINPSKVVPSRVRDALNSLAEGLLVLDRSQAIVLANDAFAAAAGAPADALVGTRPEKLGLTMASGSPEDEFPWTATARDSQPRKGVLVTCGQGPSQKTFSVSAVPVRDERNENRGVVASFEDVTQLQRKQQELQNALRSLKTSTEEVRKQNRELEWLATRDTLTGCLNRRSFFREYETLWQEVTAQNLPMAAVMVDIDHFKAINDNYGHSMGDEVLRVVSRTVMETVDPGDLVCRYGGEEFTVLMPYTTLDEAETRAEKCRLAIKALTFDKGLRITASLGVSAMCQSPETTQDMLDQADKCLYVAKRNGRNQVVRWDRAREQVSRLAEEKAPTREEEAQKKAASAIPFHAVAALTSALAHRDQATAVHSRRVADLCVATAEGLLSLRECYVLEIAALLHDIGKIGIPDAILRKPGKLTPEELEVVQQYNRMAVDMVQGSFGAPVLTEIVEQHVVHYDMSNAERGAGPGRQPSVAARILAICNAYDTMVSDLNYRGKMSRTEAFAELRRCAGTQFDPELVERFINVVKLKHHEHPETAGTVTKESALSIGLMLEQLISALDDNNVAQLQDITQSLLITATTHGLDEIASLSKCLLDSLKAEHDQMDLMQIAGELLDLCRATQSELLVSARSGPEHAAAGV